MDRENGYFYSSAVSWPHYGWRAQHFRLINSCVHLTLCFAVLSLQGGYFPVEDGFHGGTAHSLLPVWFWCCCYSQKSRQWGACLWKDTGNVWVVTAQVWVPSHESLCQLLQWAVWHWQELLWALVFSHFGTTEDEVVCELYCGTIVAWFLWRPASLPCPS